MELALSLSEPQMELVRTVFESYTSNSKSIFEVDYYIDQNFEK